MSNLKEKTIHSVKWGSIGSFSNTVISFILGVILARLLDPSDYGIVGMTAIFFAIAGIFIDSGLGSGLIHKKEISNSDTSTVFYFNITASALFCIILCLLSPLISDFLHTPVLTNIVRLSAVSMFIGSFGSIQYCIMKRNLDFKTPAIIGIYSNIVSGVLGVILAYRGFGPWALVWQSFSNVIIRTLSVWALSKWRPIASFSKKSFNSLFSFGGNITVNSILDTLYNQGTSLIIGKYYSPESLGYYSKGQQNAQMPSTFIANIVGGVTFPVLSKIQDDDERLRAVYGRFMQILSLIIFFAMILLFAIGKPFILFLFSEKWLPAVAFLQIFCLRYMLYHVNMVNWYLLLAKGRTDLALKKELVCKTINFSVLIASIPFGVIAIAYSQLICSIIGIIVNTYVSGKYFNYGFKLQVKDFLPYLIKSFIFCIPAFLITNTNWNPFLQIVLATVISSTLYFSYHFIIKDENLLELIKLSPLKRFTK